MNISEDPDTYSLEKNSKWKDSMEGTSNEDNKLKLEKKAII